MDSDADLVCRVENTLWLVRDSALAHQRRFFFARLANHDDVGFSPQSGSHETRKVNADFFVDLNLPQAFLCNLDRVFSCPDFGVRCLEELQDEMRRGTFASQWARKCKTSLRAC